MMVQLVLFFLLIATPAWSATYWVRPTGTDSGCTASDTPPATNAGYRSTIGTNSSSGIACLSSGDTLYVRTGTYTDSYRGNSLSQPQIPNGLGTWATATQVKAYNGEVVTWRPASGHE